MTRSEYTQHADPGVIRRSGMRKIELPPGVEVIRMIHGRINGEDTLLVCTTDGVYQVDPDSNAATKLEFEAPSEPRRRITDINRRFYAYIVVIVVIVAVILALWGTL